MKLPRLRTLLLVPLGLFATLYAAAAILLATRDDAIDVASPPLAGHATIAILGASGTAGDGILQAALADPGIQTIHVITRRVTPRIEAGVAAGKVQVTLHTDYLDYSGLKGQLAELDAVFWALGTSSVGVDEKTYGMIHVDFPARFVEAWLSASARPGITFHYLSSSDISEDASMMWAREKVRAEKTLFGLAAGTGLRVIAYRPDYIGPTEAEAHLGQDLMYWFFAPVGAALRAAQLGQAMIEVTARGPEFANGAILGTRRIVRHSDAYERRRSASP